MAQECVRPTVRYDGDVWTSMLVEGDEYNDLGLHCSMAVDGSDTIHLAYRDAALTYS